MIAADFSVFLKLEASNASRERINAMLDGDAVVQN